MPPALRREVRLLGDLLGQVLTEFGGAELLDSVEQLRRTVIASREDARRYEDAERLAASWSLDRAEQVARAFACYFHLANLAEERHRARILRDRARAQEAVPESLAASVAEVRADRGEARVRELVAELELHPVFTAHPTEARRRAVVTAVRRIDNQLEVLEDPRCSADEQREARRRLLEEIDLLWRTSQLRTTAVQPQDEVRTVMSVFDDTLFRIIPAVYRRLDAALGGSDGGRLPPQAPAFVRFGSWVGGDRDGNPLVTAEVTAEAARIQTDHVLRGLEAATTRIGRALTVDTATTAPSSELTAWLSTARTVDPEGLAEIEARSPGEPHRQFLLRAADRVRATRLEHAKLGYGSPAELLEDLRILQRSLAAAGAARLAYGEVQHLVWQVETFGFHLAELEVRQHSKVHEKALAELRGGQPRSPETEEVLATLRVVADLQARLGPDACRRYVVSFTRDLADVAAVYELAELAVRDSGGTPPMLDVVPLFETSEDLQRAPSILESMLELEPVRRRLADGAGLEVMLGYSDSTKEIGPVSATLALHEVQARLVEWAAERGIRITIFHGRGGALGRGGGPANRAVLAQPPGSLQGHFKVTEQGEVIFARYGNPAIALRHLEQIASAVLLASSPSVEAKATRAAERFGDLTGRMDEAARTTYRELVETEGFEDWFARVSPIEELSSMRIGSRPARRQSSRRLEDLRAIPWVFAWSQMRLNLPGWYGLGSALAEADLDELRQAYAEWPLFNVLLDNAEMSLAKTDRRIAARYLELGGRPELTSRVLGEYDLTTARVLAVTGHSRLLANRRVLSWAVELRNPYVDALSHLQLRALRALRAGVEDDGERERVQRLLLLTVNGVAAGLQNTG
ncbi:MAG: phosphoenolpyruvate carboxylase [Candidatus Dormibacteraeota bacterium]|nr:phosphoenolpyruvate carboxylase [Candidatus Dormibacteraeota bacterium]